MDYLKPQSPIMKGGTGIYPLTTYDQVIMKDGSRFTGEMPEFKFEFPIGFFFQWAPVGGGVDLTTPEKVNSYFGYGTWKEISGKFLFGRDSEISVNSEGGEKEHSLTKDELPKYNITSKSLTGEIWNIAGQNSSLPNGSCSGIVSRRTNVEGVGYATSSVSNTKDGFIINASHTHSTGGGDQPHNNMPPYLAVYIWQRIA